MMNNLIFLLAMGIIIYEKRIPVVVYIPITAAIPVIDETKAVYEWHYLFMSQIFPSAISQRFFRYDVASFLTFRVICTGELVRFFHFN